MRTVARIVAGAAVVVGSAVGVFLLCITHDRRRVARQVQR